MMDGEDALSAPAERSNGSGRLSWSKRSGQGHNRPWGRISLGGLGQGRRREKEAKGLKPRSPSRRTTLGGAMREEGVGAGGAAYHGRHGIRYMQTHSDTLVEELKQEEDLGGVGGVGGVGLDPATPLPASPRVGQMVGGLRAGEHETIAEEDDAPDGEREGEDAENEEGEGCEREANGDTPSKLDLGHRRDNATREVNLMDLNIDGGGGQVAGGGGASQISPCSEARRGSTSPGILADPRPRTQSWAPSALSPPVLSGPFSRTRSRSRSPRHRMSVAGPSLDSLPRLQGDLARLSSGNGERPPALSQEPSVSTAEEYMGWSEGEGGAAAGGEQRTGPFSDSSLVMARLRLPNTELGFEDDGFFGIDVRSLIIGREIARGAYGVVHEGVLLKERPKQGDGDQSGSPVRAPPPAREEGKTSSSKPEDKPRTEVSPSAKGVEEGEGGDAKEGSPGDAAKGSGEEGAQGQDAAEDGSAAAKEDGTSVAVKIQQVPLDEEEQANLLGELGVLRNYQHPHLVEFIGTAMAMERGANTVMVAMELCTNGALRETLKLNISWPLKVRIALDMTDGLQYLHQHGIIHRDIKTPNVLIDGSWRAKLCDYNFAIDENSSIKQEFCAGTAEFMSPEVLLSEEYGLPSDIFSLGMIFVEMLTGQEPSSSFPERPPQTFFVVSEEEIEQELLADCPSSFSLLQSQCLFSEPAERPTAEDAHNWLQDLLNEMGEENVTVPQAGPPLPVLTEGAAIAREGNVINASPKGSEHHWFDSDAMEHQIGSMAESAVDRALERALAERGQQLGLSGPANSGEEESSEVLEEMRREMEALRASCEERDSRISDLEVQALRNTSTLKMLSSALEVAYKMLEAQQAALCHPSSNGPALEPHREEAPAGRDSLSGPESEDFDAVEAKLSQVGSSS